MEAIFPVISELLERDGRFARWLEVEAALASAQAQLGIIPQKAAEDISAAAHVEQLDLNRYDDLYAKTGHPMVAMLRLLEKAAGPESGQYIHLGATTQDVMDTALMLAVKAFFDYGRPKLASIRDAAVELCQQYADTPMMGRTHNIQALPITFGYKAAVWADELQRSLERLDQSRERILVLQLSGAVGSMVSFGENGDAIQALMSRSLGLGVPGICWHVARDRFAEFTAELTLIAGCLGRIAQEIYLLMGTEIGELGEPWAEGTVGSSTMPHKINPTNSQTMMSLARDIRYHNGAVQEMMWVDHERNLMHFAGEREHIEAACLAAAQLLDLADQVLAGLRVNVTNMRANLDKLGGLTQSEHVMLELGKAIGKQHAHERINHIAVDAFQNGKHFETELIRDPVVSRHLTAERIHALLDPLQYLGQCPALARRTAERLKHQK